MQKVVLKHHDYFVSPNRMHKRRASKLYTRDFRSLWKNLRDKFRCLILLHIDEGPVKVMPPMQSDYEATTELDNANKSLFQKVLIHWYVYTFKKIQIAKKKATMHLGYCASMPSSF